MTRDLPCPGRIGALLSLLFVGIMSVQSRAADPVEIKWHDDYATAQSEAKAKSRPIWIQFTGPWCHYCVRMDRETFKDAKVARYARDHFVAVKLQSDVHERLALSYGLSSLPATVLIKPSGELISKREGFADSSEFRAFLDDALGHEGRLLAHATAATSGSAGDGVALAGYSPVSLVVSRRLISGQSGLSLVHEGRVYRFASESELKLFQSQPERFIPVNGGFCPVATVDRGEPRRGTPRWGAIFQGHLYLCADQASQRDFLKNPVRYAHVDVADRRFCAHCWGSDRLLSRGLRTSALTRGAHSSLVPDPTQLTASRISGDRARR